jgi:V/A-type H+-transporting ATPase subunit A
MTTTKKSTAPTKTPSKATKSDAVKPESAAKGSIIKISGPLVVAKNMRTVKMFDVVHVGPAELIGEVIELRGDCASIQVYEETAGLKIGDPVATTSNPLCVELGPGIMGGIYDGIGRPLDKIHALHGARVARGVYVAPIDRDKKWEFAAAAHVKDFVSTGDILGTVQETEVISHRIIVPHGVSGVIEKIKSGLFTVTEPIAVVRDKSGATHEVTMLTKWPVRVPRPYKTKLTPCEPLVTGQRVIDSLFPLAKGGVATVPGPFGSGKTVVQHQIAKWSDAEIVVYIGCGERGNEICDVLHEFPHLIDKRNGATMIKRTILIANTSDMPVAAREASVYTGITIAEYFRDQGYNVAVMADSTSRWAEALREMSGRMQELPGEEGYPAYLASRIANFYERAGLVEVFGQASTGVRSEAKSERAGLVEVFGRSTTTDAKDPDGEANRGGSGGNHSPMESNPPHQEAPSHARCGSITVIGAVSPPGGDLSEPVSQATMRIVKTFWALSYALAYRRHFPAIDWLQSYSLYAGQMSSWYARHVSPRFLELRARVIKLLQQESELQEIVRLVGADSLAEADKKVLAVAKNIREKFLHQNAFDPEDTFTPYKVQYERLAEIMEGLK